MTLRIEDHWLVCDPDDEIELRQVRGRKGRIITPEVLVIHYAVTDSIDATVAAQQHQNFWAHLSIDGWYTGEHSRIQIVQHLPFNEMGSHAGQSNWRGRSGVNAFSIGIEIANPGPLIRGADGKLRTVWGKVWPEDDAVEARHKSGTTPKSWTHWARFSKEEVDLCAQLYLLLREHYPIVETVGHDDISPGRKSDPGPAFALARAFAERP